MDNGERVKILAARLVSVSIFLAAVYLILRYVGTAVIAFFLAYLLGWAVYALSLRIYNAVRIPRRLCAVLLLTAVIFSAFFCVYFAVSRAVREIGIIVARASDVGDPIGAGVKRFFESLDGISKILPLSENMADGVSQLIKSAALRIGTALTEAAGRELMSAPRVIFLLVAFLITVYYVSLDFDRINAFAVSLVPLGARERFFETVKRIRDAFKAYAKAYPMLFFITFCEVLAGMLIMKRRYALVTALAVAAVDILPVLGAGAVLLPWAAVSFVMGRASLGCGVLVLYGIITIVRQIAEPKLIGKGIGIHPLWLFFCMTVLSHLFGFEGFLLSPIAALIAKELLIKK